MYDATLVFKDGVSLHFTDDKLLVFCNAPGGTFERNKDGWEFRCNEENAPLCRARHYGLQFFVANPLVALQHSPQTSR